MPYALEPGGYVDEAAAALTQGNVFVSAEVGAPDLAATLQQQIGDASIGVAVFSDNAALEASGPEIVLELNELGRFDTIIVAVGDDLSAGSKVLERGEATRIANEAEDAGSVEAALVETVQTVMAASDSPAAPPATGDGGPFIGIVIGAAALVAAGGVLFGVLRARRRNAAGHRPLPDKVRPLVGRLHALSGEYAAAGAAGDPVARELSHEIATIAGNTTELFDRLARQGDEGQRATAALEYGETLRKLTAALDRDYLLDILSHPNLWDDPADRVGEVRAAVSAFSGELVENIKQVNARRGLHFQVSLDGLIGRRKELQEWDREFDRASDADTGQSPRAD